MHPAAEVGTAVSPPRGPAEAQRVPAEAAGRGGRPGAEDEAAAGGQRPQTEAAGGHEEGAATRSHSFITKQSNDVALPHTSFKGEVAEKKYDEAFSDLLKVSYFGTKFVLNNKYPKYKLISMIYT